MSVERPQRDLIDGDLDAAVPSDIALAVRRIVRAEMLRRTRSATPADIEDICSDAMVSLLMQLERHADPPENFGAYVAAIARRSCSAWSRRRFPAFHRLRSRLRYLLKTTPRFVLWVNDRDEWLCGSATTQGAPAATAEPEQFTQISSALKPAEVLDAIFARSARPLYFNDLARICAHLWAIEDEARTFEDIELPAQQPDALSTLSDRQHLLRVWTEINALPQRQSAALLLNLHAGDGDCAVSLLVMTATATLDQIAATLGMPAEDFAALWQRLPLEDTEIAALLGATRQQVINLRKCARERLRRRIAAG